MIKSLDYKPRLSPDPPCIKTQSIIFIKSGIVKLLRKVDFKVPTNSEEANDSEFLIQDPSDMDYFTRQVDQKLLEVDEFVNGDNFGEKSVI